MVGGSYNCEDGFKVAGTATMPMLGNLGLSDFHSKAALALAIQLHEATVTQDGGSDVRKCLISFPHGDGP